MTDNYSVEKLLFEELDKLTALKTLCFGTKTNPDFFKWRYFDNPDGEAYCLIIKHKNQIVGSCAIAPEKFIVFGVQKTIYKYADLMIHPEHRSKGLAAMLVNQLAKDLKQMQEQFLYTFCGNNSAPSFVKNGWTKIGNVNYYFKTKYTLAIKHLFNNPKTLFDSGILKETENYTDFFKGYQFITNENEVHLVKSKEFFEWRLRDPRFSYKLIGYYENENLIGYAIYNCSFKKFSFIVDIEAPNKDIYKKLINAIEYKSLKGGFKFVFALALDSSPFHKILRKSIFQFNPLKRGPLHSLMNVFILNDNSDKRLTNKKIWNLYTIHYDDI